MAGQGNNNQGDKAEDALWVGGMLLVVILVAWHFVGPWYARVLIVERLTLDHLVSWVVDPNIFRFAGQMAASYAPSEWNLTALNRFARDTSPIPIVLLTVALVVFAWRRFKADTTRRLRRQLDKTSFMTAMEPHWPWTLPVRGMDLLRVPTDKGPWAMSPRALEFVRAHGLMKDTKLDATAATALFTMQMGSLWSGPEALPRHHQAIVGCIAAFVLQNREEGMGIARDLVRFHAGTGGTDEHAVAWCTRAFDDPRIQEWAAGHAYALTVTMRLLAEARARSGVIQSALFLWVRPLDRRLWYTLNVLGRRATWLEVAGVYQHYRAERTAKAPLIRPAVDNLVQALQEELDNIEFGAADVKAAAVPLRHE